MSLCSHDRRALASRSLFLSAQPWPARLLAQVLNLAGDTARLHHHREKPWSSATFSGARHGIRLSFAGEAGAHAGEAFLAALPEHEFTIPGTLVADAAIVEVDQVLLPEPDMTVTVELLLLDDV